MDPLPCTLSGRQLLDVFDTIAWHAIFEFLKGCILLSYSFRVGRGNLVGVWTTFVLAWKHDVFSYSFCWLPTSDAFETVVPTMMISLSSFRKLFWVVERAVSRTNVTNTSRTLTLYDATRLTVDTSSRRIPQ